MGLNVWGYTEILPTSVVEEIRDQQWKAMNYLALIVRIVHGVVHVCVKKQRAINIKPRDALSGKEKEPALIVVNTRTLPTPPLPIPLPPYSISWPPPSRERGWLNEGHRIPETDSFWSISESVHSNHHLHHERAVVNTLLRRAQTFVSEDLSWHKEGNSARQAFGLLRSRFFVVSRNTSPWHPKKRLRRRLQSWTK